MNPIRIASLALLTAAGAPALLGEEGGGVSFKFSGFLSVVGGKVLNGNPEMERGIATYGVDHPFYVADWANWGVYDKSFSLKPESRIGVQALVKFTEDFSFTGQVVSRGPDTSPALQWAYLSYNLSPNWEIQAGRKRIPLYFYSDFQDIGVSYPWVTPPPELYGWEATNYNGASLRFKGSALGGSVAASVFGGKETVKESRYMLGYDQPKTDVTWKNILGGDLEFNRAWFTARGVYMTADAEFEDRLDPANNGAQKLKSYGLALNGDFGDWFALTEIAQFERTYDGYYLNSPVFSAGAGIRLGKWTPFLNYAQYRETTDDSAYIPQNYKRGSFTVRYDITPSHAVKLQVDRYLEFNGTFFSASDATIVRIAFDMVF